MSEHPAAKRHRAYAQAVDEAFAERGYLDGHKDGYVAGLTAARDAVDAAYDDERYAHEDDWGVPVVYKDLMLAAIDALRLNTADCLCPSPNPDCQHPTCPREGK